MKGIVNVLSAGCIKGLFKDIGDFVPNPLDRAVRMSEKILDAAVGKEENNNQKSKSVENNTKDNYSNDSIGE